MPLVLFPTYAAPKYKYGYHILILFGGLAIISVTIMWYAYRRRDQKEKRTGEEEGGEAQAEAETSKP